MQRGLDWYKRDPIAFLDAVQGLGPELIGAYSVILDLIYARGGETLRDDRHLSGVMGCSMRKAKSLTNQLIEIGKLEFHDGLITNSRAKRQAKRRRELSETNARHGRTGGINSGQSRKNKSLSEANASSECEAEEKREEERREEYTPPDSLPPISNNSVSAKKNGVKKGGDSFEASRWFSASDIETYEKLHPDLPIATKLADADFREWCFKKNKADPQRPARQWIDNEQTKQDGFSNLKTSNITADDCKPSSSLLNSKLVKSR